MCLCICKTIIRGDGNEKSQIRLGEIIKKFIEYEVDENDNFKDIKIFYDGWLPIREVVIGPIKDQLLVKESIEHFLKSKYYYENVEVKLSDIPYRG